MRLTTEITSHLLLPSNQLTAKTINKHEGYNFCDMCHETLYQPKEYGPGPGGETIEERRAREKRELEERERRLREIEEMRNKKVSAQCGRSTVTGVSVLCFSPRRTRG